MTVRVTSRGDVDVNRISKMGSLSAFAIASAMAGAAPGHAQEVGAETADAGIADIIVTTRRREEAQQDVPISISAYSGQAIQYLSVRQSSDLASVISNLARSTAVFGLNVANKFFYTNGQDVRGPLGVAFAGVSAPREWGIEASAKF